MNAVIISVNICTNKIDLLIQKKNEQKLQRQR